MTLIDRLSKLEGPDREVDAEICIALQYVAQKGATNIRRDPHDEVFKDEWLDFEVDGEFWTERTPDLTASVDAAIALAERVLPGHQTGYLPSFFKDIAYAGIVSEKGKAVDLLKSTIEGGATPAIALCIAILRAKEARK